MTATLDDTFKLLEQAAIKGDRCPQSSGPDATLPQCQRKHVTQLALAGKILVEISSKNWRRITILVGPNKGKATAPNPDKHARAYQIIDASGTRVNGKRTDHGAATRRQPSQPRFLEPLR